MSSHFGFALQGRRVIRSLLVRRVRSLLTLAGVVVGVAGVTAVVFTARNLARAQALAYDAASQADVTFWVWDAGPGIVRSLAARPAVVAVEQRWTEYVKARLGDDDNSQTLYLVGLPDPAATSVNRLDLLAGRYPGPGETLLEISSRELAPVAIGDTITYRDASGRERSLIVSGFARSPTLLAAQLTGLATAFVHARPVQDLLGTAGANQLLIRVTDPARARQTAGEISRLLDKQHLQHGDPDVRDAQNFPGKRELDALFRLLGLFATLGLALSGVLVGNTLAALVVEEQDEIGTLKALGADRRQVMAGYLLAASAYGLVGTPVGIVLGGFLGWRITQFLGGLTSLTVPFALSPDGVALGLVVGVGVTVTAGLFPAWHAANISVHEALQPHGLTTRYGADRLQKALLRLRGLPPMMAMSLRNLSRRRLRSGLTVLVIALAVGTLLAAQTTEASVNGVIDEVFRTYRAQGWVFFRQAVSPGLGTGLQAIPGVTQAEPWTLTDAWVRYTPVRLWGLPADTRLYHPNLVAGRWYRSDEPFEAVVSADLVARQGLGPGDTIEVDLGDGRHARFHVVGVVIDNTIFLGSQVQSKVFAPRRTVARLRNRQDSANLFALGTDPASGEAVQDVLTQIERRYAAWSPAGESAQAEVDAARKQSQTLGLALRSMVILVGLIGAIGLANTLTISVLERRREIGVLRALGASDSQIAQAFLTEGAVLGLLGWILGLAGGQALGRGFVNAMEAVLFRIPYVFPVALVPISLAFALGIAVAASLGPAWVAARLRTIEVLRYE